MATSRGTHRLTTFFSAAGAAAVLVLAPVGVCAASAATSGGSVHPADSSAPQCQLFGPIEAGLEQFEQAFDSGSGQSAFTGSNDIAAQIAAGTGCPIPASSGAPSGLPSGVPGGAPSAPSGGSGGGSSAPQCQLFDPVTGGLQQVEAAFDSGSGQGAFAGSNDIAAAIDSGAGCSGTTPLAAPSGGSSPSGGSGSGGSGGSSAPQCQLFVPLAGAIEQVEQAWDSGSGQSTFTGSNDIAAQILTQSGCASTGGSGRGNGSGGGNNQSGTGSQGGSSGGGPATNASGGSSGGSGGSATFADSSGSSAGTGGGSGSLPFTGEPSWIPFAGVLALVLALVAALLAIGMRVAARLTA